MMPAVLNRSDGPTVSFRKIYAAGVLFLAALAGCTPMQSTATMTEAGRYLVYFNEFSANLSPDAQNVIAEAASKVKEYGAKVVKVEGRANATGSVAANQRLTETRTQVVYDELRRDGVDPTIIQQQPLGQVTTTDTSVMDRRVDIVLLK
jgi:outer membrane protein OmpA-like peptidoglycan-associated protein